MAHVRKTNWREDAALKNDLEKYVKQDLRREILDFVNRDYSEYAWSFSSLDRRMRYFGLHYTDRNMVEEIRLAVEKEVDGPGKLLGYRAMQKKLQEHDLKVPRDLVYAGDIDTASRKILWLKIWVSNSDPQLIGRRYLEHLYQSRVMMAHYMRIDN